MPSRSTKFLKSVALSFDIPGVFLSAAPYGTGHINETYATVFDFQGQTRRYILQRLNDHVFPDIPGLMDNIARVTEHLHRKLASPDGGDLDRRALTLIPTRDGQRSLCDWEGGFWRAYIFIEGARTYDLITSPVPAYEAAKAFGTFARSVADIPEPPLLETIPGFHDTGKRLSAFLNSAVADSMNRAASARPEIRFCLANEGAADALSLLRDVIPRRIAHNDTKLNNVMLDDATGSGICVLDLDTVMPGLLLSDFGDIVRTATMRVAEDERDLTKVEASLLMYDAVTRGYLEGAGDLLTPLERDHLVTAGEVLTFECGVRFLTDYLQGDHYFRVSRPDQNLDRARVQFALLRSLRQFEPELRRCIARAAEAAAPPARAL